MKMRCYNFIFRHIDLVCNRLFALLTREKRNTFCFARVIDTSATPKQIYQQTQKQNENIAQRHTKRLQRTTCVATTNALAFCNKQVSNVEQSSGGLNYSGKTRKKLTKKRTNFGTTIAFVCYLWYNIFIEIWRKN